MLSLRGDQPALFASDMHLSDAQPATADRFLTALEEHADSVQVVFLLGDLFDAWVGDDCLGGPQAERVALELIALLRSFVRQGKAVWLQRGNRDFLLGCGADAKAGDIVAASGAGLLPEICLLDLHGQRACLVHGDQLCTDDIDYQAFRRLARSQPWQRDFLAQPLAQRIAIAAAMRRQSEQHKRDKTEQLMDVNQAEVIALMRAQDTRLLIHGHTHRPAHHRFQDEGRSLHRWVLPDWEAQPARGGFLLAQAGSLRPVGDWPAPVPGAVSLPLPA